jgi:hypothetical protein
MQDAVYDESNQEDLTEHCTEGSINSVASDSLSNTPDTTSYGNLTSGHEAALFLLKADTSL